MTNVYSSNRDPSSFRQQTASEIADEKNMHVRLLAEGVGRALRPVHEISYIPPTNDLIAETNMTWPWDQSKKKDQSEKMTPLLSQKNRGALLLAESYGGLFTLNEDDEDDWDLIPVEFGKAPFGKITLKVGCISLIPAALLAAGGGFSDIEMSTETRSAFEQMAGGALLSTFAGDLFAPNQKPQLTLPSLGGLKQKLKKALEECKVGGEHSCKLLAGQDAKEGLVNASGLRKPAVGLFFAALAGFALSIVLDGLLSDTLTAVESNSTTTANVTTGELAPFFVGFATDGLLLAYEFTPWVGLGKMIFLAIILGLDNVMDALGVAALIKDIRDVDENVMEKWGWLAFMILMIPLGAFIAISLRALFRGWWSQYLHTFIHAFGVASIAAGALELAKQGFTLWVLIGFLLTWTFGYIGERCGG